jgi:hypothetical protein
MARRPTRVDPNKQDSVLITVPVPSILYNQAVDLVEKNAAAMRGPRTIKELAAHALSVYLAEHTGYVDPFKADEPPRPSKGWQAPGI